MKTTFNKPYCRSCRVYLGHYEMDGMSVYICPRCDSKLMGLGELDKKVQNRTVLQLRELAAVSVSRSPGDCGFCGQGMKGVRLAESNVHLDVCLPCDAIWFGGAHGEYEKFLLEQISLKPSTASMLKMHRVGETAKDAAFVTDNYKGLYGPQIASHVHDRAGDASYVPHFTGPVFILMILTTFVALRKPEMFETLAHSPSQPLFQQVFTTMTAFFVHGSWWHLLGNLGFYYLFADNVERRVGSEKFLILVGSSLYLNALFYFLVHGTNVQYHVGASVGIMAIMSYYVMADPFRPMRFRVPGSGVRSLSYAIWSIPAWGFFLIFLIKELAGLRMQMAGLTNVSHSGHLIGVLVGVAYYKMSPPPQRKTPEPPIEIG